MPSLNFCATLNNYTPWELAHLKNEKDCIQYFLAGFETAPTTGTPHLQIYFQLKKQVRITTMHGWDGWGRMSKIQPCKGDDQENYDYCTKGGNFFEYGERKPHKGKGHRTDLDELQQAIKDGKTYDEICEEHFNHAIRYHKFIKERVQARDAAMVLDSLRKEYNNASLLPWQEEIKAIVQGPVDPRKVHWYWEKNGNVGKTWITKYLAVHEDVCFLDGGKKADLAHTYSKSKAKNVIFNLSRTIQKEGEYCPMDGMYAFIENLKDGMIFSPKFDSGTFLTMGSTVIIFANFAPNQSKLSQDRWVIREL